MRNISKLQEPHCLTEYRASENAKFENLHANVKGPIKAQLVQEQLGLCCYCCGRIKADHGKLKVEHWKAQAEAKFPQHQLDYWNLLGACPGGEGQPEELQHCDSHKGNSDLSRNPADPVHSVEESISYLSDGTIQSSINPLDKELGKNSKTDRGVLNLNVKSLINRRKAALDGFKQTIEKRGNLKKPMLERLLQEWGGEQGVNLKPYAPVVAFWLRKRLSRC